MYLGIDIGSSSSKVAILNEKKELAAISIINLGTGTDAPGKAIEEALSQAGITREDISYTVATGYGRITFESADRQITEITCHAKGVTYLSEDARTIVDIGGQDAKVIKLNRNGQVENFVMNEKCAAGTGRFLEVMARVLGCGLDELSGLADQSTKEVAISSVCTVFAESEVISRLAAGEKIADVARGAHVSIARRVAGLCSRVGYEPKVVMTGGVALNRNVVDALSKELGCLVEVVPHCQAAGAVGAAMFAWEAGTKEKTK
ncbi:acyl-CoA dehydratase activase [Hornefia butyriciproducens]|uniref:acyl-CoA dehydratase activase n=1 Tax=Hornefia butyriciproducens TaxID=2652293 RepID=UPI002A916AC0|nr:acyl-CoA dehydratase activase [Hornefia butyriciproducens]MCI7412936.1 acyl-CoA dehydratase activase [Clostridiales bacterium]MDY5423490.1 acyl-CoA dehydratase activase [Hornefia butyriciproducens]MDY6211858.1 acyl-CoA dehydratase activase [Hornefia butyriciproducens]